MMYRLLGVAEVFFVSLFACCVSSNRRADANSVCACPVCFRCVADIAPSRESQLNVGGRAHHGARDRDAYGRIGGIRFYRSER